MPSVFFPTLWRRAGFYVYEIRCPGRLDGRVGLHKLEERHVPARFFFRVAKQLCKLCTQAILLNLFTEKTGKLQDYVNDKPHFCSAGLVSPNGFHDLVQ